MQITERIEVPTGHILLLSGSRGPLETVVMGDYGKDVNLGHGAVADGTPLMPLTDKWVFSISTQYGCSMGCQFCDVPKVGPGVNASLHDLQQQVLIGLKRFVGGSSVGQTPFQSWREQADPYHVQRHEKNIRRTDARD